MKNRFLIAAVAVILTIGSLSCGKPAEPEDFILTTENVDRCISSVGQYKGLKVIVTRDSLTDESIDYYTDYFFEKQSQDIKDWIAEDGDTVVIDYDGFFAGTKDIAVSGKGQRVVLGRNSLINGFDRELLGVKEGDTKEFTLSFPADYQSDVLAGVSCDFKVSVTGVIPGLSDKAVRALESEVYTNEQEYRTFVYYTLKEYADSDYRTRLVREVLNRAAAGSVFTEIPEGLLIRAKAEVMERYEDTAERYGLQVPEYLEYCGTSLDAEATSYAKEQIVLFKIAKEEGLEAGDAGAVYESVSSFIVDNTN